MADEKMTLPVRLPTDVIEMARIIAAIRNLEVSDLLSDILRPILARMEQEAWDERSRAIAGGTR
jgi:hypothetical protein